MRNRHIATSLILTAAGSSTRMGGGGKKELRAMPDGNGTVLSAAVTPFLKTSLIDKIVVTFPQGGGETGEQCTRDALFASAEAATLLKSLDDQKLLFVEGGRTRQESIRLALEAIERHGGTEIVLIHDGARPFVMENTIRSVHHVTVEHGAATCAVTPVDTQKEINGEGIIVRHLNRSMMAAVQTPQGFLFEPLLKAHKKAADDGRTYTDDTEIWAQYESTSVHTVQGSAGNKKITFPEDLQQKTGVSVAMRTGIGYDMHKLVENRRLVIGGVDIPHCKGEAGHSDGDVLLHAVTDSILGAAGIGDIGEMFPPSDPAWKDADSKELLRQAWNRVTESGWELVNMDCVVKLEKPKLLPYRQAIREEIARVLDVPLESVFVKAKTGEGLGAVGTGEAVEVWVVCMLSRPTI